MKVTWAAKVITMRNNSMENCRTQQKRILAINTKSRDFRGDVSGVWQRATAT